MGDKYGDDEDELRGWWASVDDGKLAFIGGSRVVTLLYYEADTYKMKRQDISKKPTSNCTWARGHEFDGGRCLGSAGTTQDEDTGHLVFASALRQQPSHRTSPGENRRE